MIVRHEKEDRQRTCASVRSSLSAQAWRVTAGSEAAETTYPGPQGPVSGREAAVGAASIRRLGARLSGMPNESELPSGTVKISRAKDAEWLRPKGNAVGYSACLLGAHGHSGPPVYWQGLTHSCHQWETR